MLDENQNDSEPYYLRKAAAKALSATENGSFETVYRWLLAETNDGSIPIYLIGKAIYVRLSEVNDRIRQLRQGGEQ